MPMKKLFTFLFLNALVVSIYAQTGATCAEAAVISSVPYSATGLTTVGTAYASLPCSGSGFTNYMSGNDYVFSFTPSATTDYSIKLTNTSYAVGLFVTNLCPDDPSVQCIANNNSPTGNPSLVTNLTSGQTYYIIVSSISMAAAQTNFDISINICNGVPVSSFTFAQNAHDVTFTNTSTDATNYEWYFGDELLPPPYSQGDTAVNPTHTYASYGDFVVTLISYNACGATDTLTDTISIVCPGTMPHAAFTYNNSGLTVSFTNQSVDAVSYGWYFGDELIPMTPTDINANPSHTYQQYGTFDVTLIATNECGNDTLILSVTITCPGNLPVASFTMIQNGATVDFTSTSTDATSWSWFFGETDIFPYLPGDSTENPSHTYIANGTYTVNLIVSNECGSDTISQTVTITGLGISSSKFEHLSVYPNPANDFVNINFENIHNAIVEVKDLTGKILIQNKIHSNHNIISISNLAKGVYIMNIKNESGITSLPLIKE